MRYVGGKSKLARQIAAHVHLMRGDRSTYIEPFLGGGAAFAEVAPMFDTAKAGDTAPDLVMMWQAIQGGWTPPAKVTREEYAALRDAPPSALRGFVGFGASFGGKWFGGYAAGSNAKGEPRNYADEASRRVAKMAHAFQGADLRNCSYDAWTPEIGPDVVVYCDPPYAGTQGYGAAGEFDTARFWETAAAWRDAGALVLVSEYAAPANWVQVAEFRHRRSLQGGRENRPVTSERLFA